MITALYDFRSKQEYIYRTNRIREISGASALIANFYDEFFKECKKAGITLKAYSDESKKILADFDYAAFAKGTDDGQVIYVGGGNLFMLYRSKEIYLKASKLFSDMVIDRSFSLSLAVCCVECTGSFNRDREALYKRSAEKKQVGYISVPDSTLPFTQVDRVTFAPIVKKAEMHKKPVSLSHESVCKLAAYDKYCARSVGAAADIDMVAGGSDEFSEDSLIAVIYIDGNFIGAALQEATAKYDDYNECVKALREFSARTQKIFIDDPVREIDKVLTSGDYTRKKSKYAFYRKVVLSGDEITLICNAHAAFDIVNAYFRSLEKSNSGFHSGAGIAICHAGAPFSTVYRVAEECSSSAKNKTRLENCVDWHFCRFAITGELESMREDYAEHTNRAYTAAEFAALGSCAPVKYFNRTDIKNLVSFLIRGYSYYAVEVERLKAKYGNLHKYPDMVTYDFYSAAKQNEIYDIADVYDIWFA